MGLKCTDRHGLLDLLALSTAVGRPSKAANVDSERTMTAAHFSTQQPAKAGAWMPMYHFRAPARLTCRTETG